MAFEPRHDSGTRPRAGEAGFSVVEGLVAALLLAIILIGVLPMIDRSMQNNLQGNDATRESNAVVDKLDELYALQFNSPELTIQALPPLTELATTDYFLQSSSTWSDTLGTATDAKYTRSLTVEYFGGNDLEDGQLDTPLAGDALPGSIQLKRLTIELARQRAFDTSRIFDRKGYEVVALKAY